MVFWSLSFYKELKLTTNCFTGWTLCGLLIQMQTISLRSSGMRRKPNFEIVFGFKSDTAVSTFTFRFLSSFLFSLFLPHFFFSCWAFSRLHLGRVFGKSFRILGLGERKVEWAIEQDFHGDFQANVTWFFCLFLRCPWLNCAHSGMVWKISSLCTSLRTKLSLTVKTDHVTKGRKDVDPHGQLQAVQGRMG